MTELAAETLENTSKDIHSHLNINFPHNSLRFNDAFTISCFSFTLKKLNLEINEFVEYIELVQSKPLKKLKHKKYEKLSEKQDFPIEIKVPLQKDFNYHTSDSVVPYHNTVKEYLQNDFCYKLLHGEIDDYLPKECL